MTNDSHVRRFARFLRSVEARVGDDATGSLLDAARREIDANLEADGDEFLESLDAQRRLLPLLEKKLSDFLNGPRGAAALGKYCTAVAKAVSDSAHGRRLTPKHRRDLLGEFVERGVLRARGMGRPSRPLHFGLLEVWEELHNEGLAPVGVLLGKTPNKMIAARIARDPDRWGHVGGGRPLSEEDVREEIQRLRAFFKLTHRNSGKKSAE